MYKNRKSAHRKTQTCTATDNWNIFMEELKKISCGRKEVLIFASKVSNEVPENYIPLALPPEVKS
jgi:hypothetical protein